MKSTRSIHFAQALAAFMFFTADMVAAPLGTAFTYQGRLTESGSAADGEYDLRFAIYDSNIGSQWSPGPVALSTDVSGVLPVASGGFTPFTTTAT